MAPDAAIITEVDVLVDPNDATVDIVAIPGLGANPIKSWMGDEKDEKSFNWLKNKDGLQKDFPKGRIMLYHYASAYRGDFKIRQYMSNIADTMLVSLQQKREHDFARSAMKLGQKVDIHCFYEQKETRWDAIIEKLAPTDFPVATLDKLKLKEYREFVCRESATLPGASETGLARTHRDLVRFGTCKDSQYQLVRAALKRIVLAVTRSAKARFNYTRQFSIDPKTHKSVIDALDGADVQRKLKSLSQRLASDSWILKEPEFRDWLEDKTKVDDFLWIYGAEGRGKKPAVTAVVKNIESTISKLEVESSDRSPTLLAYFFCDQNPDYCTAEDVVKSLLRQLCLQQESLANYAKQFIPKAASGGNSTKGDSGSGNSSALGIENLCQCLRDMLTESSIDTVYFIICNLHELPEEEDSTKKLLSFLQSVVDSPQLETGKRVRTKWLFATRDRIAIRRVLSSNEAIRKIDLKDSEKYGNKKGYNKAIAYFAGSVINNRAESTKWIDVAVVQLAALPAQSNDIKILSTNEEGLDTIKELLRALVLTHEDPTENELLGPGV
ncbi:hypothetical protein QBC40DRAFT_254670 [Triangularia verruculosa]|uniref:Nephrocystin 3-like N-terminal domain-containing protein n=1 Tax=Triangularia verruculosa TaxID=2587418 RepID=A0AAN6XFR6_9PEZI|nr:hypothetical protein QBC40DRAFT_254670 [Triangularia verruculosa]